MTEMAKEVFYRFEDRRYSVADEWGDHTYTSHEVALLVFPVIKHTKCGVWIGLSWSLHPKVPREWDPNHTLFNRGKRFINLQATKRFALPSIAEAAKSYRARKERQISIYKARIAGTERHLEALKSFLQRL